MGQPCTASYLNYNIVMYMLALTTSQDNWSSRNIYFLVVGSCGGWLGAAAGAFTVSIQ
jgi:hypothetical protein